MIDLKDLTSKVADIAKEAGTYLRESQSTFNTDTITSKSLNALVSEVDQNTERLLVERLSALLPEAGFLTEEETTTQDLDKEYTWVIDPLDGTTNFLHGLPIYSVSLALLRGDWPVIGVVYEVGLQECFTAYKDGGAYLNGLPLQTSRSERLEDTLLATGFPYYNFSKLQGFQDTLAYFYQHTRGVRRIGTAAVDLAYTAAGRFDGYFEYGLSPWDVAAGVLLVREAGGSVTNFNNDTTPVPSESIIAANKSIHGLVFEVVEKNMGNAST